MKAVVLGGASLLAFGCSDNAGSQTGDSDSEELIAAPIDQIHKFDVGICAGPLVTDAAVGPVGTCRSGASKCSGTLVGPNLVLTARHCARPSEPDAGVADPQFCDAHFTEAPLFNGVVRITTSPSLYVGTPKWYDVSEIIVGPTNRLCDDDVALLVLTTPVPHAEARYVGVDTKRNVAHNAPYEAAIVGRGIIALEYQVDANGDLTGAPVTDRGDLQRRVAQHIPFLCASDTPFACTTLDHSVSGSHRYFLASSQFLLGPAILSGDSGSGIFDQASATALFPRVIGVGVWGTFGPDGKSNASGGQRLDRHRDWILAGAKKAALLGGYRDLWWTRD